jgi:hypothetical protein
MKAERIANKSARAMVQLRRPFEGSNLFAREAYPQHGISTLYVVFSYGEHWPLYVAETDEGNNTQWYVNADKFSQSTSRHQSQCNPYDQNCIPLTAAQMRRCATEGIAGVAAMGGKQ